MPKKVDLTDQTFGDLYVICEDGRTKGGQVLWKCRCKCGREKHIRGQDLRTGKILPSVKVVRFPNKILNMDLPEQKYIGFGSL